MILAGLARRTARQSRKCHCFTIERELERKVDIEQIIVAQLRRLLTSGPGVDPVEDAGRESTLVAAEVRVPDTRLPASIVEVVLPSRVVRGLNIAIVPPVSIGGSAAVDRLMRLDQAAVDVVVRIGIRCPDPFGVHADLVLLRHVAFSNAFLHASRHAITHF